MAKKWLDDLSGLAGVFTKLAEAWAGSERRAILRQMLLDVFPKPVTPGVCYRAFYCQPTRVTRGYIHPTMLSYQPAAFDMFFPYEQDFLREVQAVWDNGFSDSLRVTPFGAAASATEGQQEEEKWCLFTWGPDGSYKDFVNSSAIIWLSTVAAIGEIAVQLVSGAVWLCAHRISKHTAET